VLFGYSIDSMTRNSFMHNSRQADRLIAVLSTNVRQAAVCEAKPTRVIQAHSSTVLIRQD
jgi:hypothetical protein